MDKTKTTLFKSLGNVKTDSAELSWSVVDNYGYMYLETEMDTRYGGKTFALEDSGTSEKSETKGEAFYFCLIFFSLGCP